MRKILMLLTAMVYLTNGAFAQKNKVQTAWNYYKYDELDKAKQAIDEASIHETTIGMAKTWYYKGMIYQKLYKHPKYGNLEPNSLVIANQSYDKALEIEKDFEFKTEINQYKLDIGNKLFNEGVEYFGAKKYDLALVSFEAVLKISPNESTAMLNAAYSADKAKNVDKAIYYYNKVIENAANSNVLTYIKKDKKTWMVPCQVNGVGMSFEFDPEANNVAMSAKEALSLFKSLKLDEKDFKGTSHSQLVNGQVIENSTVNIREFKVDGILLTNVEATLLNKLESSLLLGQSAIEKLGTVSIQGDRLTITAKGGTQEELNAYISLSKLYKEKGDTSMALSTIQKGRQKFPAENALVIEELNIYLATGQSEKALEMLNVAIQADPMNPNLRFARGTVYDKLNRKPEAAEDYKKAIELKPDYFEANYNLGAMYFNEAAEMANKANEIKENNEYNKAKKQFDAKFKEAQPYLEKAHELNPKDTSTMISLKQLYARTGETEKHDKIKAELEKQQ